MENYLNAAFTPAVLALQQAMGASGVYRPAPEAPGALDQAEVDQITTSDSFYLATVSETGWPYVQHRGGSKGFVTVLGPTTIGWLERIGNRQYLGTGNITADARVSAIFVDYPARTRLKLRGMATYHPEPAPDLVSSLGGDMFRYDGAITIDVVATDWNCPKYITQRFTANKLAAKLEVFDRK